MAGPMKSRSVEDVTQDLISGKLTVEDLPIQVIYRDGKPRDQWINVDMTGDKKAEKRLNDQLKHSGLDNTGIPTVQKKEK
jgi:hypothetical protein